VLINAGTTRPPMRSVTPGSQLRRPLSRGLNSHFLPPHAERAGRGNRRLHHGRRMGVATGATPSRSLRLVYRDHWLFAAGAGRG